MASTDRAHEADRVKMAMQAGIQRLPSPLPSAPDLANVFSSTSRLAAKKTKRALTSKSAWSGSWDLESLESDTLEEVMQAEGTPLLIRKMLKRVSRKVDVEINGGGGTVFKLRTPFVGTVSHLIHSTEALSRRRKPVTFNVMGTHVTIHAFWEGDSVVLDMVKNLRGHLSRSRVVYSLAKSASGDMRLTAREEMESGTYGWVLTQEV